MRVYHVGRSMLALVVLFLGTAPFVWLIGKYAVGIGAVLGIISLAVTGAFKERQVPNASNFALGTCGVFSLLTVVSFVTGVIALVRHVGQLWPVVGAAVAALTLVYYLTSAALRVLPRSRANASRERLARRAGWRYRRADAELIARVRRLFPEFGEIYGVVDGEIDGVAFTMGTVRTLLRARGRVWLVPLPAALPQIQIKRGPSEQDIAGGMRTNGDVGYGYGSAAVDAAHIPMANEIVDALGPLDVAECRVRGTDLALLIGGAGRPEDEARLVPLACRSLPLAAARLAAADIVTWEATAAAQAAAGKTAAKTPESLFGWGFLAGFAEIACGICAWIYNGFLPGAALLVTAIAVIAVAWIGGDKLKTGAATDRPR